MTAPITITATVGAWLPQYNSPATFFDALVRGEVKQAADSLHFTRSDMSDSGWVRVGTADVTITLASRDEAVAQAINAHKEKLEQARAAWLGMQAQILAEISKLQALSYEPA